MTERPAILSAKLNRLLEIMADYDDLQTRPQNERPGAASDKAVRESRREAVSEVLGGGASVAEVERTETPSERLKQNGSP